MNVRFTAAAMRCRISQEELRLLLSGRPVTLDVPMPGNRSFRSSIQSAMFGDWQLQSDPTGIWLSIPQRDIESLAQSVPSRSGIEHEFAAAKGTSLRVSLEVDVRDRARTLQQSP